MRNYLCLLGWSPKDNREKIEIDEVVRLFELEKINRKNALFDLDKCTWLNGEYARELPDERFHALARDRAARAGIDTAKFPPEYVRAALDTCKGKFRIFSELPAYCGFLFHGRIRYDPRAWRNISCRKTSRACKPSAKRSLRWKISMPPRSKRP